MHSFDGKSVTIHYNGDYSGEAIIQQEEKEIRVDVSDLIDFIAGYVRNKRIEELEGMSSDGLLLMKK